jgi:hypothetical protein
LQNVQAVDLQEIISKLLDYLEELPQEARDGWEEEEEEEEEEKEALDLSQTELDLQEAERMRCRVVGCRV